MIDIITANFIDKDCNTAMNKKEKFVEKINLKREIVLLN